MKKIINLPLDTSLAYITSYQGVIRSAINMRTVALSNLSGYPIATQVVGKIQREFKLGSYKELLESILKMRNIALTAAEVINTIPILKVDRYQLERTEIDDYIKSMTKSTGGYTFTEADRGLIAFMITSSESSEHSWLLDLADSKDNLFIKLLALYDSANYQKASIADGIISDAADASRQSFYDPTEDKIIAVKDNPRVKAVLKDVLLKGKKIKDEKAISSATADLNDAMIINSICSIRVIDHIWSLLTSQDIWANFITPRTSVDPSLNLERANGLQLFASYLHSILMYSSIFQTELFMAVYNRLGEWVTTFPPLPSELQQQYETIVKKHDYLGAASDVTAVLNSTDQAPGYDTDSKLMGLPSESLKFFGLEDTIKKIRQEIKPEFASLKLTDLKSLTSEDYSYVLLSQPVAEYNMVYPLTETLLIGGAVKTRLMEAVAGLVPGIPRFFSQSAVDGKLRKLGVTLSFPIGYQMGSTVSMTYGTTIESRNGIVPFRSNTPVDSYDWKMHIRKDENMALLSTASLDSKYTPKFIINADKAAHLRAILKHEWKGLLPSSLVQGDFYFTHKMLQSDELLLRDLFQIISGQGYEWITRTIGNPYLSRMWATFLSSWASLYVVKSDKASDVTDILAAQVIGYGKPYGKEYEILSGIQKKPTSLADFIQITDGVFIKLHDKIPTPSRELKVDADFYLLHPYYYFQGNSTIDVSKWILSDGLLNFAFTPTLPDVDVPSYFLDKRYAYINEAIYLQTNPMFTPQKITGFGSGIGISTREWNRDRHREWITLKVPGSYGSSSVSQSINLNDVQQVVDVVKKWENEVDKVETAAPSANLEKAPREAIKGGDLSDITIDVKSKNQQKKQQKGKPKGPKGKVEDAKDDADLNADDKESDKIA